MCDALADALDKNPVLTGAEPLAEIVNMVIKNFMLRGVQNFPVAAADVQRA